jgi:predicted secreted protein
MIAIKSVSLKNLTRATAGFFTIACLLLLGVPNVTDATEISVNLNQEFTITLPANYSLGKAWKPEYDKNSIQLIDHSYHSDRKGGSGEARFIFKSLKAGETRIHFTDGRHFKKEIDKKRTYYVRISP